ncbi:MAG: lysostaphin resistance A-like protein [Hyphomicrobiales bacterium]
MKRLIPPLLQSRSAFTQLIAFIIIALISLILLSSLGTVISIAIWGNDSLSLLAIGENFKPGQRSLLLYFQVVQQIGLFLIPPFVIAFLISYNIKKYLYLSTPPRAQSIILGIVSILVALPFINYLSEINQSLHLPASLSGIEDWMRSKETEATRISNLFLNVKGIGLLTANIIVIAIIPGIGEELLFRGTLLPLLQKIIKNKHLAVWITAILFSALHFQFFGFLPRMILGALLGYLFIWSGSVWLPAIVHFFNNALAVITVYYFSSQGKSISIDEVGGEANIYASIVSLLILIGVLYIIHRIEKLKTI